MVEGNKNRKKKITRKAVAASAKLNFRQRIFVENFVKFQDEFKAYAKAGYQGNRTTAKLYGRQLLKRPDVQEYIAELLDAQPEKVVEEVTDLSPKQAAFVLEYLQDFNASRAARQVGHDPANSSRLVKHPKVREALKNILKKKFRVLQLTETDLLTQLARIIYFDPRTLFDNTGKLKPIDELDDDTAAAIEQVEVIPRKDRLGRLTETYNYKASSRLKAIELYGRFLAMWNDNINVTGQVKAGVLMVPAIAANDDQREEWEKLVKNQNKALEDMSARNSQATTNS